MAEHQHQIPMAQPQHRKRVSMAEPHHHKRVSLAEPEHCKQDSMTHPEHREGISMEQPQHCRRVSLARTSLTHQHKRQHQHRVSMATPQQRLSMERYHRLVTPKDLLQLPRWAGRQTVNVEIASSAVGLGTVHAIALISNSKSKLPLRCLARCQNQMGQSPLAIAGQSASCSACAKKGQRRVGIFSSARDRLEGACSVTTSSGRTRHHPRLDHSALAAWRAGKEQWLRMARTRGGLTTVASAGNATSSLGVTKNQARLEALAYLLLLAPS